jgi:hypothetical protein
LRIADTDSPQDRRGLAMPLERLVAQSGGFLKCRYRSLKERTQRWNTNGTGADGAHLRLLSLATPK